ncbi:ligand-dependent nuclear receptor-interacting factor 1 isoform X1 [Triplophysa rosa]|uniref:ligand-dependent nuclear receptor-interacting factor 1 isoform X1 n=1 Tax=Triplophysa rosa TaxID=992332 RepID=UPI0025460679|nr:ligand-dependent nuclear receptor-interacting factor 1 isoform X1 [Triplophysa rosa]
MEGGTGVYYQAMPAVGPDGRNVMKLIPVQKVNGQFFQTVFNTEKDNVELQVKVCSNPVLSSVASSSHSQTRLPSLQPIADGRYVLTAPPQVSTLFNTPKVQHIGTKNLPRPSKQVHVPSAKPTISQNALQFPLQTNGQPMAVVQKLPVTVKSPVLPNGHCLQIPSYAQVRTVPASALPPSIKSQIMNSVSIIPANEKQQTVVMVSPVNSVKLNSDQQAFSLTKPSQIQKTFSPHLPAHTGTSSPVCSPINSKASETVSTPIKWVVQEESGTPGPCLVPASSTQLNAVDTKSVTHVESVTSANNIVASKSTQSQISLEQITPGKDNALVMCNGKVYFVAKKNSEIAKDVMVSEGGRKGFHSISPALPASSALESNAAKVTKELDPKIKASEIIDLCDDEEESSTCLGGSPGNLPTQSQTEADDSSEDSNVIFVSYIPPKSVNLGGDKDTNCASQNKKDDMACGEKEINVREETEHTEIEIDVGQENTAAKENDAQMEKQVEESRPAERNLSSSCENVGMEGEKQLENEISPFSLLADTTSADGAALGETINEREDVSEQVHNVCVSATDNTEETFENPAPDRTTQHKKDCQLRKEFGVTSDVRICLQKIRQTEKSNPQAERLIINKRTLDGLRKVIQESQLQSKVQKMMQVPRKKTEDNEYLKEVKRNKLEQDEKDEHQDNSSLSTTNISPASECKDVSQDVSVFPMENSLISQTCQDVCSSSRNTGETVVSTASKVHIQSETSTDCSADTLCLTSSSEKTQTTSHTVSPPSALRKTPVRLKKGKVCTACPCGTVLGVTETVSSLQQQERQPAAVESHKETRKSCAHKTPKESCHSMGDHSFVKKVGKKKKNSPRKKKSPSKSSCGNSQSIISPDCSVSITTLLNASSSNLQESNKEIALSSNESECSILSNIHTQTETSEQDTSQMEVALNDTGVPSSSKQQDSTLDELPTQDLYSMEVLDAEEIKRQERIKRLKNLLRQKEAALERMRHSMNI